MKIWETGRAGLEMKTMNSLRHGEFEVSVTIQVELIRWLNQKKIVGNNWSSMKTEAWGGRQSNPREEEC